MLDKTDRLILLGVAAVVIIFLLWLFGVAHFGQAGAWFHECEHNCHPSISPTETPIPSIDVSPTEEATPSPEITVEPTTPPAGHGDGLSDGKSDGLSSCPKCTQAPNAKSPFDGQPVIWK